MLTTKHIWNLYAEDLKHFILFKVKDIAITDDLLQDTFIKVHTKLDTLKDETKLKSWLFSIARHMVVDYFRVYHPSSELPDDEVFLEPKTTEHHVKDCLYGIIKGLPKKYRDPLFLSDIKGLKQAEIADQLHLPLPTIKSQIQRGRKLISQGFIDCCDFKLNDEGYLVGELKDRNDCKVCH